MAEKWDGESFRKRMTSRAHNAQNYADQHRLRIRQGFPHGRQSIVDEKEGESAICDTLSTCAESEAVDELLKRLDEQEAVAATISKNPDFRKGYTSTINEIREGLKRFLS